MKNIRERSSSIATESKIAITDEVSSISGSRGSDAHKTTTRRRIGPIHELTMDQKADFKLAFDSFDIHGTGWIGIEELRVAIRALGYEPKMEKMRAMVAEIDTDRKGKISFHDFLHLMSRKMSQIDSKEELMKSYKFIDSNRRGMIKFEDLKQVAIELGEDINDEQLHEMIQEAKEDPKARGVTFEEFMKINKRYGGLQVKTNPWD